MRTRWRDGDRERTVELVSSGPGRYRAIVDGAEMEVAVEALGDRSFWIAGEGGPILVRVSAHGARRFVRVGAMDFVLDRSSERRGARRGAAPGPGLESPMPGLVTRIMVEAGEKVQRGQPLLAVEAMKMEHVIRAPAAGTVREVRARAGEMVQGGVELVELEVEGNGS